MAFLGSLALGPRAAQGQYAPVNTTGPSSNRVDIVFMGDGYTQGQIPTYWNDVQTLFAYLFGPPPPPIAPFPPPAPPPPRNFDQNERDPYPQYRNFFNTWRVDVVSQQSGADDPNANPPVWVNTALNASYAFGGGAQRLLYIDSALGYATLTQALQAAPFTAEVRPVAVNSTQYGGGGGYGDFAVYAAGDPFNTRIAIHELGHAFNWLGDEYQSTLPYSGPEPAEVNLTTDATGAKWAPWLGFPDVPAVGTIGAYQGGYGVFQTGVWRPSADSKMRNIGYWSWSPGYPNAIYGVPFNAICREKIILDIYSLVRPLDAWSPNTAPVIDPQTPLSVTPIDPNVILVAWYIDGTLIPSAAGQSFQIQNFVGSLGAGRYTLAAKAYDPTPWVVRNRSSLEQTVTWDVRLTGTGLASQWSLPANGPWSSPGNWIGPVPNGVDAGASFLDTPPGPRTVTVDVPVTVGTLNFDNANAYTLAGANTITMQTSVASGVPAIVNVAGGSHTITAPVTLASNTNFNVWSGALTVSGPVSGGGGLSKIGGGLLTLNGPNTYIGPTVISGGALRANSGAGLSTASNLTLAGPVPSNLTSTLGDGVLEGIGNTTFAGSLGQAAGQVQWTGSGGFSASGGLMTVNIGGNPSPQTLWWGFGGFVPSGSSLVFGSPTANSQTVFLNPIDLSGGNETVTVLDNPNTTADFATLAGAVSNGSLTKDGPGTLVLAAANTYTLYGGLTTVNAGTLAYGNPNALDFGRVIVNGGTFDIGAYTAIVGTVTLNGGSITGTTGLLYTTYNPNWTPGELRSGTISAIIGSPDSLNKTDPNGTVALTGANTYAGTTYIYGGALQANSGVGLPTASNLVLTGGVLEGIGNVTFTWPLGQGPGQVQWTYSGGFSASGGVMTVNIGGAAQTLTLGTQYFVQSTGPSAGALVFGSLTADNETRFLNPIDLSGWDLPVNVNDNPGTPADFATLAGVLSGSVAPPPLGGSLTKGGPGTLVLSAANTYTVTTYIEGGALRANSGAGLPTASNLVLTDGVLESIGPVTFIRGLGTGSDQVQWRYSGGFSAYGGRMTVNIGGNPTPSTLVWAVPGSFFIPVDGYLLLNSPTANEETVFLNPIDLNGVNPLDLNRAIRGIWVDDNPTTAADFATLAGGVFDSSNPPLGGLTKDGPGTLVLPTANVYAGGTTVRGGTLRAYAGALGTGPVVLSRGTTLDLVGQVGVQPGLVAQFYTSNFGGPGTAIMTTPGAAGWDPYTPAWTGVVPYADFPVGPIGGDNGNPFRDYTAFQTDTLSARARGFINIPVSGTYRFHSGSDDGSTVWIRDDLGNWITACSNDYWWGFPGNTPDGASIYLSAGYHEIAGGFYEGGGGAGWEIRWDAGSGTNFANSPPPSAMAPYLVQILPGGSPGFGNNVTVADSATINVTGLVSMGSLTINAATTSLSVTRGLGTTNAVTFTGTSLNGNVTIANAADVDLGPVSDGVAWGPGLTKSGPGTLTLWGPASRSGPTTLLAGTIALSGNQALGTGPVTVSGGTLNIGAYSHTPGGVTLTGGLITGPGGGTLATTGTFDMRSGTVRAALVGTAAMTKTTSGTVVLTAANSYGGGTTLTGGTLRAYGGALGTGPVVLNSGTTLDLVGQVGVLPGLVAQFYTSNFGGQGSAIMTTPGAAGWDLYTPAWTGVVPYADFPVGAVGGDNGNPFRDYTPFQTDNLSARVSGYVYIQTSGAYRFHSGSDDGSTVWVRDDLGNWVTACNSDDWQWFPGNRSSGRPIALSAGYHEIAGGFYEGGGGAGWEMRWDAGLGRDFANSPPSSSMAPYLFQIAPGGSPYFGNAVTVAGDATIRVTGTAILGSLALSGPPRGLTAEFYTSNFGGQGSAIMTTPGGAGWDPYTPAWTGVVPYADFPVGAVGADNDNPFRDYTAFQTDNLSARVRGFINIPASGTYRFHSGSDDGSTMWVRDDLGNWVTACSNDYWWGFPGNTPDGAPIYLSAGYHEIAGGFYEGGGGAGWEMRWDAGLGTDFWGSPPAAAMGPYLFVGSAPAPYLVLTGGGTLSIGDTVVTGAGTIDITGGTTLIARYGNTVQQQPYLFRVRGGSTLNFATAEPVRLPGRTPQDIQNAPIGWLYPGGTIEIGPNLGLGGGWQTCAGRPGLTFEVDPADYAAQGQVAYSSEVNPYRLRIGQNSRLDFWDASGEISFVTAAFTDSNGQTRRPVAYIEKSGGGLLRTVQRGLVPGSTDTRLPYWIVSEGTLEASGDAYEHGLGATASGWLYNSQTPTIAQQHLEGLIVRGGATLAWQWEQGFLPASAYGGLPLGEGDGFNPGEFVLYHGATLRGVDPARALALGVQGGGQTYLCYPTIRRLPTDPAVPAITVSGTVNFRSGIQVDTGSVPSGLVDITIQNSDVRFTNDLPGAIGVDVVRNLTVAGGTARIYNTTANAAATTVQQAATLEFDPGSGRTITYSGSVTANGTLRAKSGTTILGPGIVESTAPPPVFLPGLVAGRLSGSFNTTDPNPLTVREPNLSRMDTWYPNGGASGGLWVDNSTWVYSGQYYEDDGVVSFAENFDDNVYLAVDRVQWLRDTQWNTPTTSGRRTLPIGWHDFEVRFGQGGWGVGPVGGWPFALGWDTQGRGTTNLGDYATPPDSLFRAPVGGVVDGVIFVDAGAALEVGGLRGLNVLDVGGTLLCDGLLEIADGRTLTKTGGGDVTFDGPQTHGVGAWLDVLAGTVNLGTDAGSADVANLSIEVINATVNFDANQHLDTLIIGDGGKVVLRGARVVVLNDLQMGGVDFGPTTMTPEPATLGLLAIGLGVMAWRRCRVKPSKNP